MVDNIYYILCLFLQGSTSVLSMDSTADMSMDTDLESHDLRDSGYSEFPMSHTTPTNNFNNMSYEDFEIPHRHGDMNISPPVLSPRTQSFPPPPPIPPKVLGSVGPTSSPDLSSSPRTPNGTLERNQHIHSLSDGGIVNAVENYSVPKLQNNQQKTGSPS